MKSVTATTKKGDIDANSITEVAMEFEWSELVYAAEGPLYEAACSGLSRDFASAADSSSATAARQFARENTLHAAPPE